MGKKTVGIRLLKGQFVPLEGIICRKCLAREYGRDLDPADYAFTKEEGLDVAFCEHCSATVLVSESLAQEQQLCRFLRADKSIPNVAAGMIGIGRAGGESPAAECPLELHTVRASFSGAEGKFTVGIYPLGGNEGFEEVVVVGVGAATERFRDFVLRALEPYKSLYG